MSTDDSSFGRPVRMPDWPVPEFRDEGRLHRDAGHVRLQLRSLGARARPLLDDPIVAALQRRADQAPDGVGALRFDVLDDPSDDGAGPRLVARAQLLVPNPAAAPDAAGGPDGGGGAVAAPAPQPDLLQLLRKSGYRRLPAIEGLLLFEGRTGPELKRIEELRRDIERLAGQGVDAVPCQLVPLGPIIKGDTYPVLTASPDGGPPCQQEEPSRVRVAVVDTGIERSTRTDGWLGVVPEYPANADPLDVLPVPGDGRLDWFSGHGSFVSGVVEQVAPGVEIAVYRFTRTDGLGTEADLAAGMVQAAAEAAQDGTRLIINVSAGVSGIGGTPPPALLQAVDMITTRYPDVLIVAAAGNNATSEEVFPAAFPAVIGVGALTADLRPAPFSSFGSWLTCSCVGVGVVSPFVPGVEPPEPDAAHPDESFGADAWAVWSGTSFSAPQVSAAVAAICGLNPGLLPRDALAALLQGQATEPDFGVVLKFLPGTPA